MEIVVVGLGGTGSALVEPLCRYLYFKDNRPELIRLVDGDSYEEKNRNRQRADSIIGMNKAEGQKKMLESIFPEFRFLACPHYLTNENISSVIGEDSVIFSCVDNHKTRALIQRHCFRLQNVVLISGGNEFYDGNVQIHIRRKGRNLLPPITHLHPEIEYPTDKSPNEMSCQELQASTPQLVFTNLTVACLMLNLFATYLEDSVKVTEVYFDIRNNKFRVRER